MSQEKKDGVPALKAIQEEKRALIVAAEGEIEMDLNQACLALGVSAEDFLSLFEEGKGMAVLPGSSEETVIFRIVEDKIYPGRRLWQEVLASLETGRSELGRQKDLYKGLFLASKILGEAGGVGFSDLPISGDTPEELSDLIKFSRGGGEVEGLDIDLISLQAMAAVVYLELPSATRNEFEANRESPRFMIAQTG
jgi:hypothetical protein